MQIIIQRWQSCDFLAGQVDKSTNHNATAIGLSKHPTSRKQRPAKLIAWHSLHKHLHIYIHRERDSEREGENDKYVCAYNMILHFRLPCAIRVHMCCTNSTFLSDQYTHVVTSNISRLHKLYTPYRSFSMRANVFVCIPMMISHQGMYVYVSAGVSS
jgi:hypothetical protein